MDAADEDLRHRPALCQLDHRLALAGPLVVVCPTGTRAQRAVVLLKKLGFENTTALAGGLAAWRAANLPTEKTA